jgi:hypothetical protein
MSAANKDGHLVISDIQLAVVSTTDVTGFTAGSGTASKSDSKWAGKTGASAYTVGDIVTALKSLGVLAP